MNKMIVFGLILVACIPNTLHADDFAGFKNNIKIGIEASGFYWDEYHDSEKLLEETGVIYGTGIKFNGISRAKQDAETDRYRLTYAGLLKLHFGTVDYDGHTQDGRPAKTDVDYFGITLEGHLGWLIKTKSPRWFVAPELSLGVCSWTRDLNSSSDASGYTEQWDNLYSRIGLGFIFPFNPDSRLSVSGGANLPLRVTNEVDLEGAGSIKLSPEAFHPTPFFSITYDYKRFGVSFFYDSFFFGESDVEYEDGYGFLQPESYTYKTGIEVSFRVY